MDFRGFDSSIILILRVGIPTSIGDFPESLSQAILVGIINIIREVGRRQTSVCSTWDRHQVLRHRGFVALDAKH